MRGDKVRRRYSAHGEFERRPSPSPRLRGELGVRGSNSRRKFLPLTLALSRHGGAMTHGRRGGRGEHGGPCRAAPIGCLPAPPPVTGACCSPTHTLRSSERVTASIRECAGRLAGAGPISPTAIGPNANPNSAHTNFGSPVLPVISFPSQWLRGRGLSCPRNENPRAGQRISGTAARSRAAACSATARRRPARSAPPCWCRHRGARPSARPSPTRSARCSRSRARPPPAARRRWSACRWRSTASTSPAASTAGRSSWSSPTTSPSPTSAAARPRSWWSRTRSTSTSAASSPTSAWPACRCARRPRSST